MLEGKSAVSAQGRVYKLFPKRASAVLEAGQTIELNLGLFPYAGSKPFLRNKQGI